MSLRARRRASRRRVVRSPATIPGLLAWGRADDAAAAGEGGTVTSLRDRVSGTLYSSLNGTAGAGPLYRASSIGGRPALDFVATTNAASRAEALRAADNITVPTVAEGGWTSWAVLERTGGGNNAVVLGIDDSATGGTRVFQLGYTNTTSARVLRFINGGTGAAGLDQVVVPSTGAYLLTGSEDAARGELFYNGSSDGATSSTAASQGGARRLCVANALTTNVTNYWFQGRVAEFGFYDHALTAAERATLHSYVQDRYGIAVADYVAA